MGMNAFRVNYGFQANSTQFVTPFLMGVVILNLPAALDERGEAASQLVRQIMHLISHSMTPHKDHAQNQHMVCHATWPQQICVSPQL